jgi:lysophospholipase
MLKRIAGAITILVAGIWLATFLMLRFDTHEYTQLSDQQLVEAAAYLEGKLTPAPEGWEWSVFSPEPDVELRSGVIDSANAKGTVIVVPGFTATIEMIMRDIVKLHAGGYRVAAIEYRGQGASYRPLANPEKGYVESYAQLGADLAGFAEHVRIPDKPVFFYSISKGAHITMRMAGEQEPDVTAMAGEQEPDVTAYALIVPMIKVNTGDLDYSTMQIVAGLFHRLGLGQMYAPGQSKWPTGELVFGKPSPCNASPDTAQIQNALFADRESLRTNGVTMSWLYETAASTEVLFDPAHISAIPQPVKMFTAGIDSFVDTDEAQRFCGVLGQCELTHFAESRHCITRESYALYDRVIDDVLNYFDQQL